jgi:hypothetical protein
MKDEKTPALEAERLVANNDNLAEIDRADMPVADRGHWLGNMEKGQGYTGFEPHPYRKMSRQKVSRYKHVRWPDISVRPASNDNAPPVRTGRHPNKHDMKTAGEGLPVEVEFKNRRIAGYLWETAGDIRECYEVANAPDLSARSYDPHNGSTRSIERRIRAVQTCQTVRYRTMHLWRPLIDACVFGRSMASIGREYGGNKEDAAKLGRQKVIDALILAREVFWDLRAFEREDGAAIALDNPLLRRKAYALGRKATGLPDRINIAANQNMRAIDRVA